METIGLKLKTRIFADSREIHFIQCTHNGAQWQSIHLPDVKEIRLLWQAIGRYLGDLEYNNLKEMDTERFNKLVKAVQAEADERGAG